jgi:branched-chain amino acid transport system ATP-binding protein
MLELRGVRVAYGGIEAVRGVDLEVAEGEVVALLGANGAGKTTALKATMGLLPTAGGAVLFRGDDLAGVPTEARVARGMCLVPEGRAIFPNLTVRENLEIGAYAHKDRTAMREVMAQAFALFPRLLERAHQSGGTLSGGEQQMLAVARALMARPKLLLLDEPSLGIAPKVVQEVYDALARVAARGVTVLLVEQSTRLALAASRRAYVLRTGEIVLRGASAELAKDPQLHAAYLG